MNAKRTIMIFTVVGGTIGGYIPVLWGASFMSIASVLWSTIGGIAGIWIGFKLSR